jgi:hypothetical protein
MHTVDWALEVFLKRHGIKAILDRRVLYTPQELHQHGRGGSTDNFDLPWCYHSLRDANFKIAEADAILFWGDFQHSRGHRREVAEMLHSIGIATNVAAGLEFFDRHLFLTDCRDSVLRRTVIYGECLLTEHICGPVDEAYERRLERLLQRAHRLWMRDVLSAQRASFVRKEAGHSLAGTDAALLLRPEDYWHLAGKPSQTRQRGGVFFGRTHCDPGLLLEFGSRVCAELGVEPTWLPWFSTCAMPQEVVGRLCPGMPRPEIPQTMTAVIASLLECDYVITDCYHLCLHAWNNGIPAICIGTGASRFETSVSDKKKELFFLTYDASQFYVFAEHLDQILNEKAPEDPWGWSFARDPAPITMDQILSQLTNRKVTAAVQARIHAHRNLVEPQLKNAIDGLLDTSPRKSRPQAQYHEHQPPPSRHTAVLALRHAFYRHAPAIVRKHLDYRRIVAIISTFNEGDIIYHSLRKLIDAGIGVHLIDNWSTDDSFDQIQPLIGHGIVAYERFPSEGPTDYFSLRQLLRRTEQVSQSIGAEWIIHQDVDEVRCSPWPGVSLREGLERVAREGFNTVNHVVLRFRPIDDLFPYGGDMERHFKWFSFDRHVAHMQQRKAWRAQGAPISLAASAGHGVYFEGQRVFPTPFLLKHYPIRSQAHGERKVLRERRPRFDPQERDMGWHIHYDQVGTGTNFIADPAKLERYHSFATRKRLRKHPLQPDASATFL